MADIIFNGPEGRLEGKYHQAASLLLDSLGVKGIKFFDARSRGTATDTISFGGKSYNRDELRALSQDAVKQNNQEELNKITTLRQILRYGLSAYKAELEQKVARRAAMYEEIYTDSAKRFKVKEDPAAMRARAQKEAARTKMREIVANNRYKT